MEIVKTDSKDEYEEMILRRDRYKKEALHFQEEYYRIFGDLIQECFSLKIQCIRVKKEISFCQMYVNKGQSISLEALHQYMDQVMKEYDEQLKELVQQIQGAKAAKPISFESHQKIKKIYRKIARRIHPDLHPEFFEKEEIQELWQRAKIAYECNALEELQMVEVLLEKLIQGNLENIEIDNIFSRIEKLKDEIETIRSTIPYQYRYLLESDESVHEYEEELKQEIDEYQNYLRELEEIFKRFDIQMIMN